MRSVVDVFKKLALLLLLLLASTHSLKFPAIIRRNSRSSFLWYRNSNIEQQQHNNELIESSMRSSRGSFSVPEEPTKLKTMGAFNTTKERVFNLKQLTKVSSQPLVTSADELRHLVLDQNIELKNLKVEVDSFATPSTAQLLDHDVVQLLAHRFRTNSTPGHRSDPSILALSLEGGGMRGAVSAGMAAAIACLGLTDSFDAIYGSSAGSVIGAYMVSRQMCVDVYVDILPAAKRTFVCVRRMFSALAGNAVDLLLFRGLSKFGTATPGMNISFVLDGIMHDSQGLRPLDIGRFRINDKLQPLRVASSFVQDGKLKTRCFGTNEFFPDAESPIQRSDGKRQGLYACLEASMAVPGATGPPVPIDIDNRTLSFFDAFCFEPIPYRSAVEYGATHVLVLASRPEGFQPKTKPGVYERGVAPLYFRSHGEEEVARFFEKGGQQYIYAEDLLTLEEGKRSKSPVFVPPPNVLYGVERDDETAMLASHRKNWKKAHILPLKVPLGTPELSTLEQDRDEVLKAVRGGFAAAFDLLAPAIELELGGNITGEDVAKLIFPEGSMHDETEILEKQISLEGDEIQVPIYGADEKPERRRRSRKLDVVIRIVNRLRRRKGNSYEVTPPLLNTEADVPDDLVQQLLSVLPGLQGGKMKHFARSLETSRFDLPEE
jgi:predicted acylesterase/phospholipase RssA